MNGQTQSRRSKERYVKDAIECVRKWRDLFENGYKDVGGNIIRVTLHQAADLVRVPKKTLEDYYAILRKAEQIINLDDVLEEKMGYLRNLIKDDKKKAQDPQAFDFKRHINDSYLQYQPMSWDNMVIETDQFCSPGLHDYYPPQQINNDVVLPCIQIEDAVVLFPDTDDVQFRNEGLYYNDNNWYCVDRERSLSLNSAGAQEEWMVLDSFTTFENRATPDE